jgi:hypothetical protein
MNKVTGKILLEDTATGIPNLVVTVYDIDPNSIPQSASRTNATNLVTQFWEHFQGDRLGSVLTDGKGTFVLEYEDSDFQVHNGGKRPDLMLFVTAPERSGRENCAPVLHVSCGIRQHAGRTESYLIQLTAEQLAAAGLPLPTTPADEVEEPDRVVERLVKAELRAQAIDDGVRLLDKQRVERIREKAVGFEANFKPALRKMLSRVPDTLVDPASFVAPDESVFEKGTAIIRRGIEQVINSSDPKVRAPITGVIALTDEQKQALATRLGADGAIEAKALEDILGHGTAGKPSTTFIVHEDPLAQFCREKSQDEAHCAAFLGIAGNANGGDSNGDDAPLAGEDEGRDLLGIGVEAITEQDINRFVARLMDTMTSPEERVVSGLEPRATRDEVNKDIEQLAFPPSPADTPAFYDFHNLQIAFEHVWQEAIDEGVLGLAWSVYQDVIDVIEPSPRDLLNPTVIGRYEDPPEEVAQVFDITREQWQSLGTFYGRQKRNYRKQLENLARAIITKRQVAPPVIKGVHVSGPATSEEIAEYRTRGEQLIKYAKQSADILNQLNSRIREGYNFTVYAANRKERSINFGILVSYRQKWEPQAYQAGKLAKTITLAPKETQKYSKKTVIRRKRAEKEVENHLRTRREEASQTSRAEQEIVRKAMTTTNFSLTTQGSYDVGIAEGTATSTFRRNASQTSDDIKKAFHEAVFKAAQEYKDEHTIEINTEEVEEVEIVESGEITNPNDEIAVTFLFYELQRRYRVTERIHRLTPVILVAQEVPRPDEIDEEWLLAHDWILRRALLDDSFLPALNYLSQNIMGEQVALEEMRANIAQQRRIVEDLRHQLTAARDRLASQRALLERALFQRAGAASKDDGGDGFRIPIVSDVAEAAGDVIGEVAGAVGGFFFDGNDGSSGQSRSDAMKDIMARTADEVRDLLFRLEREVTTLNALTEAYSKALAEHLNHKAQVARLRVHIKQNILHYMQAIWSYEPPDQRFFRLHTVPVPLLEEAKKAYVFHSLTPLLSSLASMPHRRLALSGRVPVNVYGFESVAELETDLRFTTLAQVADLDNLLGFKGNYMIFPLKESNALTKYMMEPYVIAGFDELVDPDDLGNWTLDEFARYICCLKEHLSDEQFETLREQLVQQYERLVTAPRRNGDVIVVPTNSLFIEALPATHSLIEEFKARHRAIDVKKVQAEVREMELENIRRAARILAGEREDPEIEKKIVVEGAVNGINISDNDGK